MLLKRGYLFQLQNFVLEIKINEFNMLIFSINIVFTFLSLLLFTMSINGTELFTLYQNITL